MSTETSRVVTITTGISTTKKSAQSKKCRLLADVRSGKTHPKIAKAVRAADPMLADVMTEAEVDAAARGERPGRGGKGGGSVTLNVTLD